MSKVTLVEKMFQPLVNMVEKGKSSKQAEEVQFAFYEQPCDDTGASKEKAIAETEEMMESLKAEIQKNAKREDPNDEKIVETMDMLSALKTRAARGHREKNPGRHP